MMMDPAVKTALAFCVLLAGLCAATLLRNNRSEVAPSGPEPAAEPLLIRARAKAAAAGLPPRHGNKTGWQPVSQSPPQSPLLGDRPLTVVTPSASREAPPPLAQDYPETDRPPVARNETPRVGPAPFSALPGGASADHAPRTHKIVDGDTLPALALRYLGAASRASEIFDANRDVLPDPELLPIGVELKIPPRQSSPVTGAQ